MLFDGLGICILHTRLNFQEDSCQLFGMDLLTISVLKCLSTDGMCLFLILWTPVLYHKQIPDFALVLFCKVPLLQGQPYMMNIFWFSNGPSKAIMFCKRCWRSTSLVQICVGQLIKKDLKIIFPVQNLFKPE